eukprot:5216789-Amphidinium_carterae.1
MTKQTLNLGDKSGVCAVPNSPSGFYEPVCGCASFPSALGGIACLSYSTPRGSVVAVMLCGRSEDDHVWHQVSRGPSDRPLATTAASQPSGLYHIVAAVVAMIFGS